MTYTLRPDAELGVVRGISYGLFGPPDGFVPETQRLGATLARVYVYWNQVEPAPGDYDWSVVDAILAQRDPGVELWVTVCSSSTWATRSPSSFLPSSPALDLGEYERFVTALVTRCRGRVDYWQCNNEPSNTGLLWAGTAPEYVDQLAAFHRCVRAADPEPRVVLGGCGYDVLSSPPDSPAWQFFDHVAGHGRDYFDLFSIHLYGDPHAIPGYVESVRNLMRRHGYERPVVAGEYNGPTFFEFPAAQKVFEQTMMSVFAAGPPGESPDVATMRALYARADELPLQLRMFMDDAPPSLAAKRDRINCRQIVTRNVLAFAAGVTPTVCWNLAPEIPDYRDPFNMMGFLFGKLALMDYDGASITRRHPSADTFALVASHLRGATEIRRLDPQDLYAFAVTRADGRPLHVLWAGGDAFSGEDEPPVIVDWPWPHPSARVVDAFGAEERLAVSGDMVRLRVSVTPFFLSL
jgi:hypothetical protein